MTEEHRALIAKAKELAAKYREALADLVAIISEVDRQRLFAPAGYSSSFDFCVRELLLSEDDAYRLIRSARAAKRRPEVLSYLAEGTITARAVAILAPEKDTADFGELLEKAKNKPIREVERLIAERRPDLVAQDHVRVVHSDPSSISSDVEYRFAFNGDAPFKILLDRLKEVLSNKFPAGRLENVLAEAITDYLDRHDPLRREPAQRRETRNPDARRVPPAIRDEVWRRDAGRCAFVGEGRRCGETKWLELDHVIPWALGGRSDDPGNIRLLCRTHNQWEAQTLFGVRR